LPTVEGKNFSGVCKDYRFPNQWMFALGHAEFLNFVNRSEYPLAGG
jgi:hypothetical protein